MYYEKLEPSTQISQNIPPPPIPINKQWFPYSKFGHLRNYVVTIYPIQLIQCIISHF